MTAVQKPLLNLGSQDNKSQDLELIHFSNNVHRIKTSRKDCQGLLYKTNTQEGVIIEEIYKALAANDKNAYMVQMLSHNTKDATIIMKEIPGSSVDKFVQRISKPIDWPTFGKMAYTLLHTVSSIHDCGFAHRDIKPDNVIVSGNELVLVDFEFAKSIDKYGTALTNASCSVPGTLVSCAP